MDVALGSAAAGVFTNSDWLWEQLHKVLCEHNNILTVSQSLSSCFSEWCAGGVVGQCCDRRQSVANASVPPLHQTGDWQPAGWPQQHRQVQPVRIWAEWAEQRSVVTALFTCVWLTCLWLSFQVWGCVHGSCIPQRVRHSTSLGASRYCRCDEQQRWNSLPEKRHVRKTNTYAGGVCCWAGPAQRAMSTKCDNRLPEHLLAGISCDLTTWTERQTQGVKVHLQGYYFLRGWWSAYKQIYDVELSVLQDFTSTHFLLHGWVEKSGYNWDKDKLKTRCIIWV